MSYSCLTCPDQRNCNHPECMMYQLRNFFPQAGMTNERLLESLVMQFNVRMSLLQDASNSINNLMQKISDLESSKTELSEKTVNTAPFYQQENYLYKLLICGETPSTVLKEKGFSLFVELFDSENKKIRSENLFKVKLFSNEQNPKPLKLNITSKKIIRGTLEAFMNDAGMICFNNIVINEVSSHYINESFILTVTCENPDIKPLVIENLFVRARNSNKK